MLTKNETNNAIVTNLCAVRDHPNADRLKLATVLGTQVIVDINAKDGDLVIYFDSNLRLSHKYLFFNNLYSNKERNKNQEIKGYFGKNGRVRAQKFRGEISNGFVVEISSLDCIPDIPYPCILEEGDEFTKINGVEICSKFVSVQTNNPQKPKQFVSHMFHKHWDTKQLMRELDSIPANSVCYIEEKIHGTSGRTGNVLCRTNKPWWNFWKPKKEWKIVSGTRRVDNRKFHIPEIREEIEKQVSPHLHKGEQIYYEVYGSEGGRDIQPGFNYGCRGGEFKVMLYRVTITTPDGFCIDMDREFVYNRAIELGLERPYLFGKRMGMVIESEAAWRVNGKSMLDANTLREGVVVWFKDKNNKWTCLKHKSEEFLVSQDKQIEKEQCDVEDEL